MVQAHLINRWVPGTKRPDANANSFLFELTGTTGMDYLSQEWAPLMFHNTII
jgi:hypothetical protein